jgi:tail collar domain
MSDGFPIGAVIAFPGSSTVDPPSSQYWALCNGAPQNISGPYAPLYAVIGFANGGDSNTFNLPDYRGYFLRGTSYNSGMDPDAGTRGKLAPGGNTGNNVGSLQNYDTCAPVGGTNFTIELQHLPDSHTDNAKTSIGTDIAHWNPNPVTFNIGGGDQETRPKNAYVYFYIKYRND